MLRIVDVDKTYRLDRTENVVLKNINLAVAPGEYVVIKGESGSGKTTFLHILAGLHKPSSGAVLFDERDIYTFSDREISQWRNRHIGMVFQEFHLEEDLTVLQNVLLPCYAAGVFGSREETRAQQLLEEVGIPEKAAVQARYLSGGQKQRVAIARALIHDPEIIIADEPTANLDHKTGQEILELIYRFHEKQGKTVILVTHENGHVRSDRKFELKDGELVQV